MEYVSVWILFPNDRFYFQIILDSHVIIEIHIEKKIHIERCPVSFTQFPQR